MAKELIVRVGDLLREPGSRRDLKRDVDLGTLATSAASTIPGTDVSVDSQVMGMAGGVEVTGSVAFDWYGACRRCLEDVTGRDQVTFREVAQREPVDDEVLPIDGDLFDAEPLVRELVLSALPVAPLCSEDCEGPDPERFPTTTESEIEEAEDGRPKPDPRWAALEQIQFSESDGD